MIRIPLTVCAILLFCSASFATDLSYIVDYYPGSGDLHKSIYLFDTDTNKVNTIYTQPDWLRKSEESVFWDTKGGVPDSIASGPYGRIYFSTGETIYEYNLIEGKNQWNLTKCDKVVQIKRFSLLKSLNPNPEVETLYTLPEETSVYDIDVRKLDDGGVRVYYSTGATGADEADEIYYFDDNGSSVLYYALDSGDVGITNPNGDKIECWNGNFAFNDSGNKLYLSSGIDVPAAIFMIDGALPDAISEKSNVSEVFEYNGSISGFKVAQDYVIYFTEFNNSIHKLNLSEGPESPYRDQIVYESSTANRIDDVALPIRVLEIARIPARTSTKISNESPEPSISIQNDTTTTTNKSKYEPIPDLNIFGPDPYASRDPHGPPR